MEQPEHDLRVYSTGAQATPQRAVAIIFVIAIHVLAIIGLATGLAQNLIRKATQDLKVEVIPPKQETVKPPPPPPPELAKPPPPFVPPPDIVITNEAPPTNTITVQSKVATPPPTPKPVVQDIIAPVSYSRHNCDNYYPPSAQRLGMGGTVGVKITVGADGEVANAEVLSSSSHDNLDEAAMKCVKTWHYHPATKNGQPIEVAVSASITFQPK
jgi:protein TonB